MLLRRMSLSLSFIWRQQSPRWRQSLGGVQPVLHLMGGVDDSIKAKPGLAVTLLKGLALPKDVEQVPSELILNFVEMCSHLVVQVVLTLVTFPFPLNLSISNLLFVMSDKLLSRPPTR